MMEMFEEWLLDMEKSWSVERRMMRRDDLGQKEGKV
jgi:hypothetical protein